MKISHYETLYVSEQYHWWYRVRRELIHVFIKKYKGVSNISILDVGCGTGGLLLELKKYGQVFGLDFSEDAVNFCKSRGVDDVKVGVIESIPHPDNSFDVVLAMDVLEHVSDDVKGILEIKRVLKPGGVAIIFVPTFMFLWGVTDDISYHFRRYTGMEVSERVRGVGFSILFSTYFNFILFIPIAIIRIFVRFFKVSVKDENSTGNGVVNFILYSLFHLEYLWIRMGFKFPFGVSYAVVVKK